MMNNKHVGKLQGQVIANLSRAIFAAVVHHNDLKNWSKFWYDLTRVLNDSPDICLFVKRRKNDRKGLGFEAQERHPKQIITNVSSGKREHVRCRRFSSVMGLRCGSTLYGNRIIRERFFQFAHCRRLRRIGFGATQRVDRRTSLTEGSMACAVVDGGSNLLEA